MVTNTKSRQFWVVFILSSCALGLELVALSLEIFYGRAFNAYWSSILDCNSLFKGQRKENVTVFENFKLKCPPGSVDEGKVRGGLKRDSDHDYASVFCGIVVVCGLVVLGKSLTLKKEARREYVLRMQFAFGGLGLLSLLPLLMISFSVAEAQGDSCRLLNELLGVSKLEPVTPSTKFVSPLCGGGRLCPTLALWKATTLKCVLNGGNYQLGQAEELKAVVKQMYGSLKSIPLRFLNASKEYGFEELQELGFCPHQGLRGVAQILIILAIFFFVLISATPCFVKPDLEEFEDDVTADNGKKVSSQATSKETVPKIAEFAEDSSSVIDLKFVGKSSLTSQWDIPSEAIFPGERPKGKNLSPNQEPTATKQRQKKKRKSESQSLKRSFESIELPENEKVTQTSKLKKRKGKRKS